MEKPVGAYNAAIRWLKTNSSEKVSLLVKQYYYGIAAKRELENLLDEMGVEYIKY